MRPTYWIFVEYEIVRRFLGGYRSDEQFLGWVFKRVKRFLVYMFSIIVGRFGRLFSKSGTISKL